LNIVLLVSVFIAIGLFEGPKMVREKLWRELLVFGFLLFFGFTLSILLTLGVPVPSPVRGIRSLMNPILKLLGIPTYYS